MLPLTPNVRVTISRGGSPIAADVPGYLEGAYDEGLESAEADADFRYTHLLLVDDAVDVRDDFADFSAASGRDVIHLPGAGGTPLEVVYVERQYFGLDVKRIFLNRQPPPWPTNEL